MSESLENIHRAILLAVITERLEAQVERLCKNRLFSREVLAEGSNREFKNVILELVEEACAVLRTKDK